jgi:hypothetical protein
MPGRSYTVEAENITVTAAGGDADLVELDPGAERPIELYGIKLYTTSELQEAQEEWLRLRVIRGHITSGSTPAATPTPRPVVETDAAALFTAEIYNTTIASAGTPVNLDSLAMNVRAGYEILLPEGSGYTASGANLLVVRLMAGPTDDVVMNMTYFVRELH